MKVVFINENQLGHSSYLSPFVQAFADRPDLGIEPSIIHATPLPAQYSWWGDLSIRGLRKWGLDMHPTRWRLAASANVSSLVSGVLQSEKIGAIVVNTQSVALSLRNVARHVPTFVCLDATFEQLLRSPWFAPNHGTALVAPATTAPIRYRERQIFRSAARLLPWSVVVKNSLLQQYGHPAGRISVLPPSISLDKLTRVNASHNKKRLLFVGGDFVRKGGKLLLETFRARFRGQCELHIITESSLPDEEGVFFYRGVKAYSPQWFQLWSSADLFVFPSRLETFGIVLLEALAFRVPVVSTRIGAAAEILLDGSAGWLMNEHTQSSLGNAIEEALASPREAQRRSDAGYQNLTHQFNLKTNAEKLAAVLRAS